MIFSFSLSPEIYHAVWRTWHLIACSNESWHNYQFSPHHSYICSWRRIFTMSLGVKRLIRETVILNKLHHKKVVGRWSVSGRPTTYQPLTDHIPTTYQPLTVPTTYWPLIDHLPTTYWPHTDHLPTTYCTDHLLTTYRPPTNHLLTTYQPLTDHLPTTYRPLTKHLLTTYQHLLTTYRPPTNHLPTTYWPLTDHLPTTYRPLTNHLPTTYPPPADHLPTTCRPPADHLPTDHLPTVCRPPVDHLPTTYRPLTDHLPTTFLWCSLFMITHVWYCNHKILLFLTVKNKQAFDAWPAFPAQFMWSQHYYLCKGLWAFYLNYPQINGVRKSCRMDTVRCSS